MLRHADPLFTRILAGTDGSPNAEEAVRQAARLASLTGADLEVVHVRHAPGPLSSGDHAAETTRGEEALAEAARIAAKESGPVETRLLTGDVVPLLGREARERWADLLVVGPDAGFWQKPRLFGQVAAHALRDAHCSVLVARVPDEVPGARFPAQITCAVDGSQPALEAARAAAHLAAAAGAELALVHAVAVSSGGGVGWTAASDQNGFEPLEPAVTVAREGGLEPTREMALGRPD